jgi:hypothetical protein
MSEERYIIRGQVVYMGPRIQHLGLGYGAIFRDGIHPSLYAAIGACPAMGALFIPVAEVGAVRRELAFDYAHNMKGTTGAHVTFYHAVQHWLASLTQKQPSPSGVTLKKTHV